MLQRYSYHRCQQVIFIKMHSLMEITARNLHASCEDACIQSNSEKRQYSSEMMRSNKSA